MNTYRERNEAPYKQPIPDILSQIKDSYAELRPAERRVADIVLSDVAFAVDASNAEIARRADVSEPTVTRFCRSIGCEGVRDFKLKLAQSVVVGRLYFTASSAQAAPTDNASPMWNVVFGEARNALTAVVKEGTGAAARIPGLEVAGKTGTAQTIAKSDSAKGQDHAWFASFAPADDPQMVVVVFVERGGHGGDVAAPVARKIYEAFFLQKVAQVTIGESG